MPFHLAFNVNADAGWDTDYDYGGGDYGGGDYDYGGGFDYGGGTNHNWSNHHNNSGSSSSGDFNIFDMVSFIFLAICVIALISYCSKHNPTTYKATLSKYNDIDEERLKALLPEYDINILKQEIFKKFIQIQEAWMNFDYDSLKELCTDELYNTYVADLEILKIKNGKNIMENFEPIDIKITNIKEQDNVIVLTIVLNVEFYDYVIDSNTKKVTRGNNSIKVNNCYLMNFVRDKEGANQDLKCPGCGAPITNNVSSRCEYCRTLIVKKSKDFVLSEKRKISK